MTSTQQATSAAINRPALILVPSKSRSNVRHSVNLTTGYCSCEKLMYTPRAKWLETDCAHKRYAKRAIKTAEIMRLKVEEVLERAAAACGNVDCYSCLDRTGRVCPRTPEARAIFDSLAVVGTMLSQGAVGCFNDKEMGK
jgi:hypothetical protein